MIGYACTKRLLLLISNPKLVKDFKVQTNNRAKGLGGAVKESLRMYFADLKGEIPDSGLHRCIIAEVEKPLIEVTLELTNNNQAKTSEILGISRNTLRKKIKELKIKA